MSERNWAENFAYRATRIHHPATLDEVRALAASAKSLRVVGSRHSFLLTLCGYRSIGCSPP